MNALVDLWNVLHDGTIDWIKSDDADNSTLRVSIEYLRERFDESGSFFVLRFSDCTKLTFTNYKTKQSNSLLSFSGEVCFDILSAEECHENCRMFSSDGFIDCQIGTFTIALDSGTEITLDKLKAVATQYWDDWKSDSK